MVGGAGAEVAWWDQKQVIDSGGLGGHYYWLASKCNAKHSELEVFYVKEIQRLSYI